jgi:hypothetical protein
VIGGADDADPGLEQPIARLSKLIVGLADLEPEVVQAHPWRRRDRCRPLTDLEQEELVMRPARGEHGADLAEAGDLLPPQDVLVEVTGPLQVPHVQHDVSELLDLHGTPPRERYPGRIRQFPLC